MPRHKEIRCRYAHCDDDVPDGWRVYPLGGWHGAKGYVLWSEYMSARQQHDFYPTPEIGTSSLLDVEDFDGDIWECACGNGAMSRVLEKKYKVFSTDAHDYGYGQCGVDFLQQGKLVAPNIVTNPPYRHAQKFIEHAISIGAKKHCWLLRLAFLEGQRRHSELFSKSPPSRVHVFRKRLTIWRGDEAPRSTGTTAYAWFVWDGQTTETRIYWL